VIEIRRECQPGTFPVHVTFKCRFEASFRLERVAIFLYLKLGARLLFVLHLKSVKSEIVVRPICSSLILLKHGARALFLLKAGFSTNKIISFVVSQALRFYHFVYERKEKLLIFRRACVHNFTATVNHRALRFACEISAPGYRHSFATVIPLKHEISQRHWNKPRSNHRAITVKSRQLQCKHSYYGVKLSRRIKRQSRVSLKMLCNVSGRSFVEARYGYLMCSLWFKI